MSAIDKIQFTCVCVTWIWNFFFWFLMSRKFRSKIGSNLLFNFILLRKIMLYARRFTICLLEFPFEFFFLLLSLLSYLELKYIWFVLGTDYTIIENWWKCCGAFSWAFANFAILLRWFCLSRWWFRWTKCIFSYLYWHLLNSFFHTPFVNGFEQLFLSFEKKWIQLLHDITIWTQKENQCTYSFPCGISQIINYSANFT